LGLADGYKAIELYEQLKPKFVATHECPLSIVPHVTDGYVGKKFGYPEGIIPTRTNQILQTMLEIHKPKVWIFGHYHVKKWFNLEDVRYICINKNDYMDFPKNFIHEL
jgi:predicted phosphodiesterase